MNPFKNHSCSITSNRLKNFYDEAIIPNDLKWGQKLKSYRSLRELYQYDPKNFPKIITSKMVNDSQNVFNPITQKYYDENKDKKLFENSKKARISMISNGYDNQLKVESTYDIINLKNKLAYFNYVEPDKKSKEGYRHNDNQFNFEKNNIKPYNIITNLSLREHNFVKPELRPKNDNALIRSEEGFTFKRGNMINKGNLNEKYEKDFNIINNRYKIFNDEKMDIERKIQNLNAMKKMQNMKTYDIIRGKYLNPILEKKLQEKEMIEKNKKRNKVKDKNILVRNPINNIIYDEIEQKRLDDIEHKKKMRFLSNPLIDDFYHLKGNNVESQKEINNQNYFNPFEYKMQNKRGYNILTNESQTISEDNKYLSKLQADKLITDWDKLKNNSDEKNTLKSNNMYEASTDLNDIDKIYSNYLNLRKPILDNRFNTIDNNDYKKRNRNIFRIQASNKKSRNDNILIERNDKIPINKNIFNRIEDRIDFHMKYNDMDKDKFFGTSKAILKNSEKNREVE